MAAVRTVGIPFSSFGGWIKVKSITSDDIGSMVMSFRETVDSIIKRCGVGGLKSGGGGG